LIHLPEQHRHLNAASRVGKEETLMAEWDPFLQIDDLRREIDRAFRAFGVEGAPLFRGAFLPGRLARAYPLMNLA
jgi:hypothetical protein